MLHFSYVSASVSSLCDVYFLVLTSLLLSLYKLPIRYVRTFAMEVSKLVHLTETVDGSLNARPTGQSRSAESSEAVASSQSFTRVLAFQEAYKREIVSSFLK